MKDKHTAGLKRPPLIRKKTHALTASEKPKQRLIKSNFAGSAAKSAGRPASGAALTAFVPPKANRRKRKVPTNSPIMATKWFLMSRGRKPRNAIRQETWVSLSPGMFSERFFHGMRRERPGRSTFMVSVEGWLLRNNGEGGCWLRSLLQWRVKSQRGVQEGCMDVAGCR